MLRIFIGYDNLQKIAFTVCANSIINRSSVPVAITPINLNNMPWFTRPMRDQSTEFSFSRFLTPYLCGYEGKALFLDSDMLINFDVAKLFELCTDEHDVFVVKHDYIPKRQTKFLGNTQHVYPKKNWSSLMVFNCWKDGCKKLTPMSVEAQSGKYLHQFQWANSVGELPKEYNHLVGEYDRNPWAKVVHFTEGVPCFNGFEDQEWAEDWFLEYEDAVSYADYG